MHEETIIPYLYQIIILLVSAIVAVGIFKKFKLSAILGCIAAGIIIGPYSTKIFDQEFAVSHAADLGIVLLLFVIGLELHPKRLWRMKEDILGLGFAQVIITGTIFVGFLLLLGFNKSISLIVGFGFALSSTALVLELLRERGQLFTSYGQRSFGVLLFQDLSIVPLLAMVSILTVVPGEADGDFLSRFLLVIFGIGLVFLIGYFLIDPFLNFVVDLKAREVMLPCALLIVIGSAVVMHSFGLSMALGAFLAGVLLADSNYRHTLEADISPFRSLLMGLFFITVGMSLNLFVLLENWFIIGGAVILIMGTKGLVLWGLCRLVGSSNTDSLRIAVTLPQGGEFAFVIFGAAALNNIISAEVNTILVSIVIITMIMTPIVDICYELIAKRLHNQGLEAETIDTFEDATAGILIVGFGRFGMVVGQMLAAEGINVTAIDYKPERIKYARKLGYKVHYGDATRIDVLKAAGAEDAVLIALCIENSQLMEKSIRLIRENFKNVAIFCRATDRSHAIELERMKVDYQIRETFESGVVFGRATLEKLGIPLSRIATIEDDVRKRDRRRLEIQKTEGHFAGLNFLHQRTPRTEEVEPDDRS